MRHKRAARIRRRSSYQRGGFLFQSTPLHEELVHALDAWRAQSGNVVAKLSRGQAIWVLMTNLLRPYMPRPTPSAAALDDAQATKPLLRLV